MGSVFDLPALPANILVGACVATMIVGLLPEAEASGSSGRGRPLILEPPGPTVGAASLHRWCGYLTLAS